MVRFCVNTAKIIGIIILIGIVAGLVGSTIGFVVKIAIPILLIYLANERISKSGFVNFTLLAVGILMLLRVIFNFIHFIF
ncbi:hypothetical protein KQI18_04005 [Clostridioides mangenotii]|uniref:hypothetical protein n=1 Tax=Metaclostridioides mangenotii TaxID=1540 RepID=UPI001C1265E1|nr:MULTISPECIES: hypothetical protein [Clostridioides]MBS5787736.1 hypothetical protein [Clostridioides difficile]MBU5306944.1 hypothetical protein [Clostridioides mangenotii]